MAGNILMPKIAHNIDIMGHIQCIYLKYIPTKKDMRNLFVFFSCIQLLYICTEFLHIECVI